MSLAGRFLLCTFKSQSLKIPAMKPALSLLSVLPIAGAMEPPPAGPWTAGAWRGPGIDRAPLWIGVPIQANGGRFWLGKQPSASCPSDVSGLDCTAYPGDSTVFTGGNETLFLNTAVPGGQQGMFFVAIPVYRA